MDNILLNNEYSIIPLFQYAIIGKNPDLNQYRIFQKAINIPKGFTNSDRCPLHLIS